MDQTNEQVLDSLFAALAETQSTSAPKVNDARAAVLARMGPGWRPIETAPRDGTSIIATDANSDGYAMVVDWDEAISVAAAQSGHCWWCAEASGRYGYHTTAFTHWMPVPAALRSPAEGGK